MQKMLMILAVVFFCNTRICALLFISFVSPNISMLSPQSYETKETLLDVPSVTQETTKYSVSASLTSIFKFWGWSGNKTQDQIYQEVRFASSALELAVTDGPIMNRDVANYMNDFIMEKTNKRAEYTFSEKPTMFRVSLNDIIIFSAYVWKSLALDTPLMLGTYSGSNTQSLVICGFKEDITSPWHDKYGLMDPEDGQVKWVIAQVLYQALSHGFTIIGAGTMPQIQNVPDIDISPFSRDLNNLPSNNDPIYVGEVETNITKYAGMSNFFYSNATFLFLTISDFSSEIKRTDSDLDILEPFVIKPEDIITEKLVSWIPQSTFFHYGVENIGSENITTWASIKILLNPIQNNDLTILLRFYGGYNITEVSNPRRFSFPYEFRGRLIIQKASRILVRRKLYPLV
ncbi:hypothetical protein JN01_0453 [Entomoplasma freundtii]|uniref:Uncharacterized protein n=1 Tax=Entomoplasma freundtii TaxID=74700 RepID=A0A2K8NQT5_9MOLU|nr:hypothetical protein [Entomoplasma freundtii]ATZ16147.1 hypothetical protein EFREU_v1c01200 [Entomoplasma freundtii]TDY56952.1 hypothetical protein JN01_0453 [Entomoplasma freundtii]